LPLCTFHVSLDQKSILALEKVRVEAFADLACAKFVYWIRSSLDIPTTYRIHELPQVGLS
jgi:hypothetical protein